MLSSRVLLRAPRPNEPDGWHVADHTRLIGQDYPTIQQMIEVKHREYPGPTVIEANSIGLPVIQNLSIHPDELIEQRTTQSSKHAMLTELEMLLQQQTLKIHPYFQRLLEELANTACRTVRSHKTR